MIFALLVAGHLIGDWVVQTDHQAATKAWTCWGLLPAQRRRSGRAYESHSLWWASIRALHAHCLTYHLTMAAFVLPVWHTWGTVTALTVSWITHAFIDRRWPVRALLRCTRSPAFADQMWGVIAADQALHLTILAVIAAVAS